jgi:hypothetical protein
VCEHTQIHQAPLTLTLWPPRLTPGAGEGLSFSRQDSHGVGEWLGQHRASKVAAVYAVSDADGAVKYVGVTRNVALALEGHLAAKGPEAAASVRLQSFRYPRREEVRAWAVVGCAVGAEAGRGSLCVPVVYVCGVAVR